MNTARRIAKNTLVMIIGDIAGKILTLIYIIYAARYFQAEGFGTLSFALAFTAMFGIFSDIGFYELIVIEVARRKQLARKYIGYVTPLKVVVVTLVFGVMCLIVNLMGYSTQTVKIVYIIGLSVVFDAFSAVSNATFQAFEKMEYISIGKILKNSLLLVGVFFIIWRRLGLISFAYVYLLSSIALLVYSIVITAKLFVRPKLEIDSKFWKWLLKRGAPFWASGVFVAIYHDIDKIMLSIMVGDTAVGWYSAAYKLIVCLLYTSPSPRDRG